MGADALPYLLGIAASISFGAAVSALVHWRLASPATRAKKPKPPSLEESLNELTSASTAEKISHQLQKLDNRLRMREQREAARHPDLAPPVGAPKSELFRHYGFRRVGPEFAQHQLDLESKKGRLQ